MSYPDQCLHALFRKQAKSTPEAVAILGPNGNSKTYAELDEASDRLAVMLLRHGVAKNDTVGILMERRHEYALAYVGILKSGGGYGVMDPAYPDGLLADVLQRSSPKVVITTRNLASRLPKSQTVIVLDADWSNAGCLDPMSADDEVTLMAVDDKDLDSLAYVVFSSGTTGKPKGIACPHRGAVFSYQKRYEGLPYDNKNGKQEIEGCNVFFVWEMMRPLLRGQILCVIPDNVIYDPSILSQFLKDMGVTRMLFTPSLLEALLDCRTLTPKELSQRLQSLSAIILCGEVVTTALQRRIRETLPECKILNLYSVSECHDVSAIDISLRDYGTRKYCPVGQVFTGVEAFVLDPETLRKLDIGEEGELYVAGPTLALRYLGEPEVTAQKFPTIHGQRMYKTGDRAIILPNRELEILGRCDSMVKVRGYSVELRAIEAAIMTLPNHPVSSCCVMVQGEEGSDKFVIGYLVLSEGSTKREVRRALKSQLPHYMIPAFFIDLSELPTHEVSGKLNKKALPPIDVKETRVSASTESDCSAPRNNLEREIHQLWCDILGMHQIDVVYDSFFDCGGHSLLAASLVAQASEQFGQEIGVADLYSHSTIETLARFISGDVDGAIVNGDNAATLLPDLDAEVTLFDHRVVLCDIAARAFWRTIHYKAPIRSALITGATGFLGSFLLYELMKTMDVDKVYCIVRQSSDSSIKPIDRVTTALKSRGLWREDFDGRIHALTGDASLHHMGLSDDDYTALSMSVDLIVHCAAVVNLVYPYSGLRSANVVGTSNVIEFAMKGKIKRLGYISTNGVFPEVGSKDCREDADIGSLAKDLHSGYGQSKWVAERLVSLAADRGLPTVIFRPGNMGQDSGKRGGNGSWNKSDTNYLIQRGCIELGAAPNVDGWLMENTPVDTAAHAMVKALDDNSSIGRVFHVTNCENSLSANQYFDAIRSAGYSLDTMSWDDWREKLASSSSSSLSKLKGALVGATAEGMRSLSTFSNEGFVKQSLEFGITIPKITDKMVRGDIALWRKDGVIPPIPRKLSNILQGKVIIITGASSGIGAAIANALASAGAAVALGGRRLDRLKEVADKIIAKTGSSNIFPCKVDVTVRSQVKAFVESSEAALGPCDIFINNAGVMHYTRLEKGFEDSWEMEIDVNCKGLMNGIGAVLPAMIARGRGHILATSSDAGRKAFPGLSVYSGTKFFVEAVCQGLRLETADKGIKVTTIQPGDCKTEISAAVKDPESHAEFAQSSKDRSLWLDPQDVAEAVLFAVSAPAHVGINEILIEPRCAPA